MRPVTCVSEDKNCSSENCSMCINLSVITKAGYDLIGIIERIPASDEQTEAVVAAGRFVKTAQDQFSSAIDIVKRLAEWSTANPRDQIYGFNLKDKMDGDLMDIEDEAKKLIKEIKNAVQSH